MPKRIYRAVLLVVVLAMVPSSAQALPCTHHVCTDTLTATPHVKHWTAQGRTKGTSWVLYLNIYTGGKELEYRLLPGNCDASYAAPAVVAVLHACTAASRLDYVSLKGRRKLKVDYRYVYEKR
jgi:hypothetical protein